MAVATDQQSLVNAANPLQSIYGDLALQVIIALLAQIAGAPYSTMTANQLIALANAYQSITSELAKQVIIALLTKIVNGPASVVSLGPNLVPAGSNYAGGTFQVLASTASEVAYLVTPGSTELAQGAFDVVIGGIVFGIIPPAGELVFSTLASPGAFVLGITGSTGAVTATVQAVTIV